jgi:CHAT domain-containing protein
MLNKLLSILLIITFLLMLRASVVSASENRYFEYGYVSFVHGDYESALEAFRVFIETEKKETEPRLPKIAMMHVYRGICFEKLQLIDQAIFENQLALDFYKSINDSAQVSISLLKLGSLFFSQSKLEQAALFIHQATRCFKQLKWGAQLQKSLFQLGEIEIQRKNNRAAREMFLQSLTARNLFGFHSEHTYLEGETWFYLAKIHAEEKDPEATEYYLRKAEDAFRIYVAELPLFYNQWIDLLLFRANLEFRDHPAVTWKTILKAGEIAESQSLTQRKPDIILAQADFYIRMKDFRRAELLLWQLKPGPDTSGKSFRSIHYSGYMLATGRLYKSWFEVNHDAGLLKKGLQLFEEFFQKEDFSVKVYSLLRDRTFSGQNEKALSDATIYFASQLYEITGDKKYFETAVFFAEQFSSEMFSEKTRLSRETELSSPLRDYQIEMAQLKLKINNLIAVIEEDDKQEEQSNIRLVNLINQLENLQISNQIRKSENSVPDRTNLVGTLQNRLTEDDSYLKFYETQTELLQFLITKNKIGFRKIQKTGELKSATGFYTRFIANPGTQSNQDEIKSFVDASHFLYMELMAPLEKEFANGDLIIDWPASENEIVFEPFLTSPVQNISMNMKKFPFLLFERNIRYSGSIALYAKDFPDTIQTFTESYVGFAPSAARGNGNRSSLHSSGNEVKRLAQIFGGKSYPAKKSTKQRVLQLAGKTRILHLATHAQRNPSQPQLTELTLYGTNDQEDKLYFYDIQHQEWDNQLVILGACGTASGEYIPNYGTVSLANVFQSAGVQSVIGGNWQAGDFVSLQIMSELAENMKQGMETSKALRKAKIHFLQQSNDLRSHPYYWAVYTYQGPRQYIDIQVKEKKAYLIFFLVAGAGLLLVIGFRLLAR